MTILAATILLLATFAFCAALYERNRADNLALQVDGLRDEIVELVCRADDATRDRDRYRTSNAHLIREATTLAVDLARTEQDAVYLRSCLRRQRECAAGVLLGRQTVAGRGAA